MRAVVNNQKYEITTGVINSMKHSRLGNFMENGG
jgi:hypothetical protein